MTTLESGSYRKKRLVCFFGGGCGLLIGIAYVVIVALYASAGVPPIGGDALLVYLAKNPAKWWWIIGLSVFTDFLFLPFSASLYFVLRKADRYMIGLAAGCVILFVFLDLAVTWTNYAEAMALSTRFSSAVTEVEKSRIVTAALQIDAVLRSKLLFVYNSLTLAVGILLAGTVMLRGTFSKGTAYLGIATGCVGLLAVFGSFFTNALGSVIIVASCLTTLWVFIVGYQFCRHAMAVRTSVDIPS